MTHEAMDTLLHAAAALATAAVTIGICSGVKAACRRLMERWEKAK